LKTQSLPDYPAGFVLIGCPELLQESPFILISPTIH